MKRIERLQVARHKQEKIKKKARERKLEKEINDGLNKLPEKERNNIAIEEQKKRKLDLAETRKKLWKLRTKRKGEIRKNEDVLKLQKTKKMDEKLSMINKVLQKLREEEIEKEKKERN